MFDFKKLTDIFKDYPYVSSTYLFGSQASGKVTPMSDVDIAILLMDNAPEGRALMHEENYLSYKIAKALSVKEVDLVTLNRQGLIFQHNVLRTGRLIYDSNPDFRIRFVTRVISNYCDFEVTLKLMDKYYFDGYRRRLAKI